MGQGWPLATCLNSEVAPLQAGGWTRHHRGSFQPPSPLALQHGSLLALYKLYHHLVILEVILTFLCIIFYQKNIFIVCLYKEVK